MSRTEVRIFVFSCDSVGCDQSIDISAGDHFKIPDRPKIVEVVTAMDAEEVMRRFFGWARPTKWDWRCVKHQSQQETA